MKKYIIAITVLAFSFSFAQEKKWSLQECVNYALENNISIKQSILTSQSNEQDIISAKGQKLPSATGSIGHTLSIGNRELFPGQFVDRTDNSTFFSVGFNQTIFNGFRNTNLYKQSKLNLEASNLELARIKDDISLNVVNSYLNILFNKENLAVAQSQYSFSKKQLEQVKELVDAGVQPRGNLLDIEATLANDEQRVIAAENSLALAKLTLSQLLQLPATGFDVRTVEVGSPTEELLYDNSSSIYNVAVENRYEIKSAEKNIEVAKLGTQISKSGYYPTLTAGYNYGTNLFYSNLIDNEASFFDQLNNQKSHRFNVNLSIPIFSRFQNKTSVAKSKIQEENALLNLEQTKLTLQSNIERAFTDARAALKTYSASQKSLASQKLAFENAQERYNIGAMNSFDLDQARNRLVNAEASLINAKYDFVFKTKVLDFYAGKSLIE
ncbi:TolC family protein [Pseudofulvibacter geojedonensis]|uniref:TolC family protein n=1 Tax=Pseudofulvibacter geojedonensis TaxID=1123758 RepID=A0ABW3I1D7_9FLAO